MDADDLPGEIVIGDVIPASPSMFGAEEWRTMTTAALRRERRPIQIEGNAVVRWLCPSAASATKLQEEKREYDTVTADEIERLVGLTWDQARALIRAKRAMKGGEVMRVWRTT
jgi:hypothetical protein